MLRDNAAGGDQFGEEDRATLLEGLAEAQYVLGNKAEARQLWQEMSQLPLHQNDLRLRLMLFDLAMMADDEPGMGDVIGSLSLGATRAFRLRHNRTKEIRTFQLGHGTLVIMAGAMQKFWRHEVPKTNENVGERIT